MNEEDHSVFSNTDLCRMFIASAKTGNKKSIEFLRTCLSNAANAAPVEDLIVLCQFLLDMPKTPTP